MQSFSIGKSIFRTSEFFDKRDKSIPGGLFAAKAVKPDLSEINYPLPSGRESYTCFAENGGILWLGSETGLTRYEADAQYECDRVMYFSASRDLADNCVLALFADINDKDSVWVKTKTAVTKITVKEIASEEKAKILTDETHAVVDRHGMVTQRQLTVPRELSSRVPYGHSDNSGSFTAAFATGELFRYAVLKKERGAGHETAVEARKSALRAVEADMLLLWIAGRGDGFPARTYMLPTEPVPDDGLFYRKKGGRAVCLPTTDAKRRDIAGLEIDASAPVPERLKHLYKDEGCDGEGIVYKGDTSSDEVTHHFMMLYFTHIILGPEDEELDGLVKASVKNMMDHIISNGYCLKECDGRSTTWAKWNKEYFSTPLGWSDGCLNATQLLMYLKATMFITGEKGVYEETYRKLAGEEGYAKLSTLHEERFLLSSMMNGCETTEELMYGDNMLATMAYWLLIELEDDKKLKETYRKGYKGWNRELRREHNPAYDFPYMVSCPDETVDTKALENWFRRLLPSRLVGSVSMNLRKDVPYVTRTAGLKETSWLLPPDETFIAKYDRDPYFYTCGECGDGLKLVESCYVYTFAYWFGRYYGIIIGE